MDQGHQYDEKICHHCGKDFCYACCRSTNVDQGGKYEVDYMICPHCGTNAYDEDGYSLWHLPGKSPWTPAAKGDGA